MKFRMTSHSWDGGSGLYEICISERSTPLLACILIVLRSLEKSYRKRAEAEEYRRDFTNAMAHEMKTPLSVIRGFAENLTENPDTGKKDYYLDQIIRQTEEMDGNVKEMIQVSKLDSDDLILKQETLPVRDLLEKEIGRLLPRTEERRITVDFRCARNVVLEGDEKLIEKAFRCLL